jgi:hypothetical protein
VSTLRVGNLEAPGGTGTITVPTGNVLAQAGGIIQVKQTVKTDVFTTTSSSFVDLTGLTVSITPTATSSKILVLVNGMGGIDGSGRGHIRLRRASTDILIGDTASNRNRITLELNSGIDGGNWTIVCLDSPNTTSSTTYGVQVSSSVNSRTLCINRGVADDDNSYRGRGVSTITAIEVTG